MSGKDGGLGKRLRLQESKKFFSEPMVGIWEPKLALKRSKSYRVGDFYCGRQLCVP